MNRMSTANELDWYKMSLDNEINRYNNINQFKNLYLGDDSLTPLMRISLNGPRQGIDHLLDHDLNVNARNSVKLTALHFAVIQCQLPMVKYLVENGSEINPVGKFQGNPLSICVRTMRSFFDPKFTEFKTFNEKSFDRDNALIFKILICEYNKYLVSIKKILKYLNLDNLFYMFVNLCDVRYINTLIKRWIYDY